MNARPISPASPQAAPAPPRFDRKFIEDHHLVERYLQSKLPFKGARDLENWCRAHPEYLNELKLSERAHTSLKLLEASGQPMDLREPPPPWWKTAYVPIGLSALAFICLVAFWVMLGKYALLRGELADTRTLMSQGSLMQPATETSLRVTPDRVYGIDRARIVLNHGEPQLMDVHIDMNYTNKLAQFRMFVDKKDQGRALIVNGLFKDSNGELRITLNSTGLAIGTYNIRLEGLPYRGSPIPLGWLILEVR